MGNPDKFICPDNFKIIFCPSNPSHKYYGWNTLTWEGEPTFTFFLFYSSHFPDLYMIIWFEIENVDLLFCSYHLALNSWLQFIAIILQEELKPAIKYGRHQASAQPSLLRQSPFKLFLHCLGLQHETAVSHQLRETITRHHALNLSG